MDTAHAVPPLQPIDLDALPVPFGRLLSPNAIVLDVPTLADALPLQCGCVVQMGTVELATTCRRHTPPPF